MMERACAPWIQTIGSIAIHAPGAAPRTLNGSTRVLLALLVAAGRTGTSIENIAAAYWNDARPKSWRVALRLAASHLSSLLPLGWEVVAIDDTMRLVPHVDGWVDAWRLEADVKRTPLEHKAVRPDWIEQGEPFAGIDGIELIERAADRLGVILGATARAEASDRPLERSLVEGAERDQELREVVRAARRHIFVGTPEKLAMIRQLAIEDSDAETSMIIGDCGLPLPFGPFVMSFPRLRDELDRRQGEVQPTEVTNAWRTVAHIMTSRSRQRAQRILIANAHELDAASLQLTSHLIERGPLGDFSMVLLADDQHQHADWLDFVDRAITAGCMMEQLD